MDSKELKQMLTKPQIAKLKQLTNDLQVGRVLGDRVLVKVVDPYTEMDEVEKKGLLVIPETVRDANQPMPTTGIVVAVGDITLVYDDNTGKGYKPVHEGDMVMFSKYAGSECYFNNEHFRIMEVKEILCTLVEREGASVPSVVPVIEG